jgi:hypothetical protein
LLFFPRKAWRKERTEPLHSQSRSRWRKSLAIRQRNLILFHEFTYVICGTNNEFWKFSQPKMSDSRNLDQWRVEGLNDGNAWQCTDNQNTRDLNGQNMTKMSKCSSFSCDFCRYFRLSQARKMTMEATISNCRTLISSDACVFPAPSILTLSLPNCKSAQRRTVLGGTWLKISRFLSFNVAAPELQERSTPNNFGRDVTHGQPLSFIQCGRSGTQECDEWSNIVISGPSIKFGQPVMQLAQTSRIIQNKGRSQVWHGPLISWSAWRAILFPQTPHLNEIVFLNSLSIEGGERVDDPLSIFVRIENCQ